jgi:hypothetical protein
MKNIIITRKITEDEYIYLKKIEEKYNRLIRLVGPVIESIAEE